MSVASPARSWLRRQPLARRMVQWRNSRKYLPDWRPLGITRPPSPQSRVLLASLAGGNLQSSGMERLLAAALTLRGCAVDTVLCDRALPACIQCSHAVMTIEAMADRGPQSAACPGCTATGERSQRGTGSQVHHLSGWITAADRSTAAAVATDTPTEQIPDYVLDGVRVGEHAVAGTLRFFAVGSLPRGPHAERILRRYLEAAVLSAQAARNLLADLRPDAVVLQHGIYVPQGPVLHVARQLGVRVVTWSTGYPEQSFLFSHDDTYHRTMLEEPDHVWLDAPWGPSQAEQTRRYMSSRRSGERDWIAFGPNAAAEQLPADGRPVVVAMANVSWDAQLHFAGRAFATQAEWLAATIEWARTRPDVVLVIRAHPAEITGYLPSRELVRDIVAASSPPENVRLVDADDPVSTYDLIDTADCVIVYGTKVGVEALVRGKPVITVAESWVRNKGLTIDATTADDYDAALRQIPFREPLSTSTHERAWRYAHHLFFRRMIPVNAARRVRNGGTGAPLFYAAADRASDLEPGQDPGLDVICNGIIAGTPFIYDRLTP